MTGEAGEAIDDLRNIAQLGYDEEEDQEELEILSKRLSSTFAWRHCCATITSPARSQPHRKFVSQPYIKKNNAQEGVMVISHQEYSRRRQALLAKMQPGSAALILPRPK